MKASDLRPDPQWLAEQSPRHSPPRWLAPIGVGLALLLFATLVWAFTRPQSEPFRRGSAGIDVYTEVLGPKRVRLGDYPDRSWLSYYKEHKDLLGDPLWGEQPWNIFPNCVGFTNYIVCANADPNAQDTIWHLLPALLGYQNLPKGVSPQLDAPLAPIVQAYIAKLEEKGEDWLYWLGRVISPAYCPQDSGECFQAFQRQILRWPKGSQNPDDIRLSPLGLKDDR